MNKTKLFLVFIACSFFTIDLISDTITLNGSNLTPEKIVNIANGTKVDVTQKAMQKVTDGFNILIKAAETGHKIYGLTVGVGENKDKKAITVNGKLSEATIKASQKFNLDLMFTHCAALGKTLSVPLVRATMVTRLNNMLSGSAGVQPKAVEMLIQFLNTGITPVMYETGSIGAADITVLAHIALAMTGRGSVYFKGKELPAKNVLKENNITPIVLFGKDTLGIISSNSYSSALAAYALVNLQHLVEVYKLVYAVSLEGLNGNVYPFLDETLNLRPFPCAVKAAKQIRAYLKGSYLWQKNDKRALQDPLSYRDIAYISGNLDKTVEDVNKLMQIQYNHSDDNPGIIHNYKQLNDSFANRNIKVNYNGTSAAVVPTANFDIIIWTTELEKLSLSLGIASMAATQRTLKLSDPQITKLPRFLGGPNSTHAFGAIQKPVIALNAENQYLSNPIMLNFQPVAGNIEDIATNSTLVIDKINKQIENLYGILAFEFLHATQAIGLRKRENPKLKLSNTTSKIYKSYRKIVPFMTEDRELTIDINKTLKFLKQLDIKKY